MKDKDAMQKKSLVQFFVLVFTLSIPFWVLGAVTNILLLPGLPISAFAVLCPVGAAVILVHREGGAAGVSALFKRCFDYRRIRAIGWLVPVLFLDPVIKLVSFFVIRLQGVPIPLPQISVVQTLALFGVFFIGAQCEELGWSGYAIDPLQDRYGALRGSLLLGLVWVVYHYIPLLEAHRSWLFIGWWSLGTLATRVIIVWLYNNTGRSVFVAALFHAILNLTWQLFPIHGSFYDPQVTSLITALVAVGVVFVWGAGTLTQGKLMRLGQAD
jgi:uncharacterized protein